MGSFLFICIFLLFIGLFTYFQIDENTREFRRNKRLEAEMEAMEERRLKASQKRAILYHNLTSQHVNPEKDYLEDLRDITMILYIARLRLEKPACRTSFDMRWLPVIRGYIGRKEVKKPTEKTKEKLRRALSEYKESSFSYKAIKWALDNYPDIE